MTSGIEPLSHGIAMGGWRVAGELSIWAKRKPVGRRMGKGREGQIAEAFFQRLLWDTPAGEAVATLAQFWAGRLQDDAPQWRVSLPEYQAQLILVYAGEVGNGGHAQFFMNRGRGDAVATIGALQAAGLHDWADMLEAACGCVASADIWAMAPADLARLHGLDLRAYETFSTVDAQVLTMLRAGQDLVLRPERVLPGM